MKRLIVIVICGVFITYLLVLLSSFNFFRIAKIPVIGPKIKQASTFVGLGALFVNETSMRSYGTSYRFYQNGRWQDWKELEMPLFEEYLTKGRLSSLKHNRLDIHLSKKAMRIGIKQDEAAMLQSKAFAVFVSHLFYSHNQNRKPDTLEISFKRKIWGKHPAQNIAKT